MKTKAPGGPPRQCRSEDAPGYARPAGMARSARRSSSTAASAGSRKVSAICARSVVRKRSRRRMSDWPKISECLFAAQSPGGRVGPRQKVRFEHIEQKPQGGNLRIFGTEVLAPGKRIQWKPVDAAKPPQRRLRGGMAAPRRDSSDDGPAGDRKGR